ncbi:sulfate transporter family-domain-containing protein [Diplogelasinospora grovesii]|uniref:Sulfate transporter family-domain-containing protein n=1 Tax=Diplogelasinospora grovesii TaxID=303347 RepID=A0AAN6MWI2_9PEZI|nr:sulfate transporter family-domain-containing protein [Diplogelasinospora grovesii]
MAPSRVKRFLGIDEDGSVGADADLFLDGDSYIESEPSTRDMLLSLRPTVAGAVEYLRVLFPFLGWIFHYNVTWLFGDFIAGITVGFVVVPQGMAYALLANLPPEYGLYTSFVGFLLYWAFATSKDITIGAVAVMSTIVGNIIITVQAEHPELKAETIARGLALISGVVLLFLGLIRAGFIVEFIPLVAIGAFMTGSAISIAAGQVPSLMGISGVNTRDPTYLVIVNTLKGLPSTKLDAAMGLTALAGLYSIRWFCGLMGRRFPRQSKMWFFVSTLRMAFVVVLYILVSWLVNRNVAKASNARFKILGTVPSGFQHAGVPQINRELLGALAPQIPTTILVLLIEHIAISKSFGRINNYIIDPSQELVAIGFSNVFGPFLGGYPATGSFSRTAIKAKAGVRTPLAGVFTAVVVLLALYCLTSVFYYIPSAALAAIIIHAVGDLITPPREVYKYWLTSPIEVVIFFAGVFVSIFTSIENGIYVTVAASAAVLLFRTAKLSSGKFLGRINVYTAPRETIRRNNSHHLDRQQVLLEGDAATTHEAFIPLDKSDSSNPDLAIKEPYPGVFIYRFGEGLNYTNSARHLDNLTIYIFKHTRRTELNRFDKVGDRPWNDPGPRPKQRDIYDDTRLPTLRAVVLDLSAVNFLDVTAAQALIDLRDQFDRYAAPDKVEWHFAGASDRWTKRALVASGFGVGTTTTAATTTATQNHSSSSGPLVAVAESSPPATTTTTTTTTTITAVPTNMSGGSDEVDDAKSRDIEAGGGEVVITPMISSGSQPQGGTGAGAGRLVPIYGMNRPFFHVDVATAVKSAVRNAEASSSSTSRGSDSS